MNSIPKSWLYFVLVLLVLMIGGFFLKENRPILDKLSKNEVIYVQIKNGVNRPGIYEMRKGDTLKYLIEKAGGFDKESHSLEYDLNGEIYDGQVIILGDR
ncbi:MAG: SLBB domain-containing protein [Leptospiraceae bacterium]|nr:SLBB domain-containing protein [Leptospiraceae bacterium]MCZ8347495.1 SLBB domain-containing protein [Leptospiraceae bacterium]PJE03711.1 MAG: hypothetical protein CK427_04350 [Leptospira sp.]